MNLRIHNPAGKYNAFLYSEIMEVLPCLIYMIYGCIEKLPLAASLLVSDDEGGALTCQSHKISQ